jgi:hypothetical protein
MWDQNRRFKLLKNILPYKMKLVDLVSTTFLLKHYIIFYVKIYDLVLFVS